MFNKTLFVLSHQLCDISFYSSYQKVIDNQFKSYNELEKEQEKHLRNFINFAYKNVPFYHKVFRNLNLSPEDIKKINDLEKLPIITKETILENWDDFKPLNLHKMRYYNNSTGGSTGVPLKFRVSYHDRFLAGALLYRGWGYAGYELGDKMIFLAGSSLIQGTKSSIIKKANEVFRNIVQLSSFDMSNDDMKNYVEVINSFKPRFLRGYASSIDFFAKYVGSCDVNVEFDAIFTTAEKLNPQMRKNIENVFSCDVFDGYGLFDGGVGAYECMEHDGLHVDTERSIMEIVDKNGSQIDDGIGRIIATNLNNYAMPFIRYNTGDLGDITSSFCACQRGSRLLKNIVGRQQEILRTPEGKFIHGEFFTHIFWNVNGVKEFQVIQKKLDEIIINMVLDKNFDDKQINYIKKVIEQKSELWKIKFQYVEKIDRTQSGKYKFVISELNNKN